MDTTFLQLLLWDVNMASLLSAAHLVPLVYASYQVPDAKQLRTALFYLLRSE